MRQNDVETRITRLERRIRRSMSNGSLNPAQANRALRELNVLRQDEARINARLDTLGAGLRLPRSDYDR